jgi:5'-3' exoribonuclease 1
MSRSWAVRLWAEGERASKHDGLADGRSSFRCSEYRGSTVAFTSCLNLTRPQFAVGGPTGSTGPKTVGQTAPFQPRLGPQPAVQMQHYQPAVASRNPVAIMRNPARAPPANGNLQYGNAAKGIRPAAAQPAAMGHHDRLASVLTGQQRSGQNVGSQPRQASQPGQHVAHHGRPHAVVPVPAKSPVKNTTVLPAPTSPKATKKGRSAGQRWTRKRKGKGCAKTGSSGGAVMRRCVAAAKMYRGGLTSSKDELLH